MKFANRDGVKLAYLDEGSGDPALLFIHGWCCDHTYWSDQIPEFARRHRVVAVDLRGLGESDKPDEDASIEQFSSDVAWLCGEIGLEKPVIVGHSMGGLIALDIARKHSQLARGLVFNDAVMMPFPEQIQPLTTTIIEGLRSPAYKDVASNFFNAFLFGPESPATMKDDIVTRMTTAPQRHMHTAYASIASGEAMTPGPLPVPSLFVRAATGMASEDEIKARYPGMEITTVNCAHFIQMEKPQEFNAILREFVEKVS